MGIGEGGLSAVSGVAETGSFDSAGSEPARASVDPSGDGSSVFGGSSLPLRRLRKKDICLTETFPGALGLSGRGNHIVFRA